MLLAFTVLSLAVTVIFEGEALASFTNSAAGRTPPAPWIRSPSRARNAGTLVVSTAFSQRALKSGTMGDPVHDDLVARLAETGGVVMMIGAPDTGKTTFSRMLIGVALDRGRTVAYIDSDLAHTTVGPPTCVGLKRLHSPTDLESLVRADDLRFVGGIAPDRFRLQQVAAVSALVDSVREEADLIVIDTSGTISGVIGQTLKYHKVELARPDTVVALQRGAEIEPLAGLLGRFLSANVETVPAPWGVTPMSPGERADLRASRFRVALQEPLERWLVRPTVFAPSLPAGIDLSRLDRLIVGVHDRTGRCLGLGVLEYEDSGLRVNTSHGEGMAGLRIGSARLDRQRFYTTTVNLREVMFGLE